jgi:signal transduction histidine kinase/HAMP domain-containing protein
MAPVDQKTRHYFGIGFRIKAVISILFVLLMMVAALSYRSLNQFGLQLDTYSGQTLPALAETIELTGLLKELVQQTESLMNSDIQANRRIAFKAVQESLTAVQPLLLNSKDHGEAENIAAILAILEETSTDLNSLIENRINTSAKLKAQISSLNEWATFALATSNTPQTVITSQEYTQWLDTLRGVIFKISLLPSDNTPRAQRQTMNQVSKQLRQSRYLLNTLPQAAQNIAKDQLNDVAKNFQGDQAILVTLQEFSSFDIRSKAIARQLRVLVDEILRNADKLASNKNLEAQNTAEQLVAKTKQQLSLMVMSVISAALIAFISFIFIERQVLSRLLTLRDAVQKRAAGGTDIIPIHGSDEVTEIGQAFQYFINEIDGRQARLVESENQLRSVIRHSPQAMCILTDQRILYQNDAFEALLPSLDIKSEHGKQIFFSHLPQNLISQDGPKGVRTATRHAIQIQDAAPHWYDMITNEVEWFGEQARQLIIADNTKQVQVEQTLENARRKAEAAAQAKTNFLAMMSHEIRSPMNGIISVGEILEGGSLNPEQQELVRVINQSAETLLTILNDILDLSKIEAGKMEIAKIDFDLHDLVNDIASLLRSGFQQKNVKLDVTIDPDVPRWMFSDANRIRQILFNLLGNALKFTEVGTVNITANVVESKQSETPLLLIKVQDTGIGIEPNVVSRLFQPFEQADSSIARKYGGTGLGLSICRRLTELLNGSIEVDSKLGKGSTFIVTLPLIITAPDKVMSFQQKRQGNTSRTDDKIKPFILVVEDNKINQLVIGKILKTLGYEWDTANDGIEAIEVFDPKKHGIIITDLRMPRMDGFTLAKTIRSREISEHSTPIIALSADAMEEVKKQSENSGFNAFLTKPVKVDDVRKCLSLF